MDIQQYLEETKDEPVQNVDLTPKKGLIYRIVCNKTNKQYIGSTTQSLAKRKYMHKKGTTTSKEIITNGDWRIEVIEEITFDNRKTLLEKERHYIQINAFNCVNKNRPIITQEEKIQQLKKNMRSWYLDNKEKQIKKSTEYNQAHKEKHKEHMRRYYQNHREKFREYQKKFKNKKTVKIHITEEQINNTPQNIRDILS
jgi:hypothetical protein